MTSNFGSTASWVVQGGIFRIARETSGERRIDYVLIAGASYGAGLGPEHPDTNIIR